MGRKQREKKKNDAFRIILLKSKASLKDIGRCRCVCKAWRSFLSTPQFIRNHQVTIDDYKVLVCDGIEPKSPFRTYSLDETLPCFGPNPDYPHDLSIKASFDGLLCVAVSTADATLLLLTNPLTRATKMSPRIPHFCFAPTDAVGFYIHPSNNDYKLVCLPLFGVDGAFVYSHVMNSWKHIEFSFVRPGKLLCWSPATFYGECLYFEVRCFRGGGSGMFYRIICFDVKTETFKEIPAPPLANATGATFYSRAGLVVLNGCLHLYVSYNISDVTDGVDVWRMKDGDDDDWEEVDVSTRPHQQEETQLICTQTTGDWVAVLDQRDNSFKKMSTEEFRTRYRCFSYALIEYRLNRVIYVQTLVKP